MTTTLISQPNELFLRKTFISDKSDTLLYRFLKPYEFFDFKYYIEKDILITPDSQKFPLLLFLHGAGERGIDNEKQLTYISPVFNDSAFQKKYPCFVLAPQCVEGKRWVEVDWTLDSHQQPDSISSTLYSVIALLNHLIEKFPIDTNRIYITGLSMGGFGTWDIISRYPTKFAAAIPICGGADENTASKIKDIPIWTFHGDKDKVVKTIRSRNMYSALKKIGSEAKYTEFSNVGHFCWNKVLSSPEVFEWLFAQHKNN